MRQLAETEDDTARPGLVMRGIIPQEKRIVEYMSYTLTPVIVDIDRVTSAIGSGSTEVIREIIRSRTEEMLDIDALGDSFDEFESRFLAEYAAYKTGDFSYKHQIVDPPDDATDDDDPELAEIKLAFLKGDTAAVEDGLAEMMKGLFENGLGVDINDDEDTDDNDVPRELSTGGALCDLILGRKRDPQFGYKYCYALMMLCEHLGHIPSHDHWHSINSSAFSAADQAIASIQLGDADFSIQQLLVDRGAPCPMPASADFPFIGYLTSREVQQLDLSALDAISDQLPADDEWLKPGLLELRSWVNEARVHSSSIVTFYA